MLQGADTANLDHPSTPTILSAMRLARSALVLLLLAMLTPGARELVTDAARLLDAGHTQHADACQDAQGSTSEHDCSGLDHHCRCCHVTVLPPPEMPPVPAPSVHQRDAFVRQTRAAEGHRRGLVRPPRV